MRTLEYLERQFNDGFEKRTPCDLGDKENSQLISVIKDNANIKVSISEMVDITIDDDCNDRHMKYKVVQIDGGENMRGDWSDYLMGLHDIIEGIKTTGGRSWVIGLEVDVADDVWTCYLGVTYE